MIKKLILGALFVLFVWNLLLTKSFLMPLIFALLIGLVYCVDWLLRLSPSLKSGRLNLDELRNKLGAYVGGERNKKIKWSIIGFLIGLIIFYYLSIGTILSGVVIFSVCGIIATFICDNSFVQHEEDSVKFELKKGYIIVYGIKIDDYLAVTLPFLILAIPLAVITFRMVYL